MSDETILDSGRAARDIAARMPEADNDYELEIHAAACWLEVEGQGDALYLTHYNNGTTLWRTAAGTTTVRCKVDWLRAREAAAGQGRHRAEVEAPDPELRAAIRDRLFGGGEGES